MTGRDISQIFTQQEWYGSKGGDGGGKNWKSEIQSVQPLIECIVETGL